MKKILAVMMAIVMMMAIAVPAFAADLTIDKTTDQEMGATVSTTGDGDDATYTVTFPAATTIEWNDTTVDKYDVSYKVLCQFPIGAKLTVSVSGDGIMYLGGDENAEHTLNYTLTGGTAAKDFTDVHTASNPGAPDSKIYVSVADFSQVPPDVYQGTITYTVAYTPAP